MWRPIDFTFSRLPEGCTSRSRAFQARVRGLIRHKIHKQMIDLGYDDKLIRVWFTILKDPHIRTTKGLERVYNIFNEALRKSK